MGRRRGPWPQARSLGRRGAQLRAVASGRCLGFARPQPLSPFVLLRRGHGVYSGCAFWRKRRTMRGTCGGPAAAAGARAASAMGKTAEAAGATAASRRGKNTGTSFPSAAARACARARRARAGMRAKRARNRRSSPLRLASGRWSLLTNTATAGAKASRCAMAMRVSMVKLLPTRVAIATTWRVAFSNRSHCHLPVYFTIWAVWDTARGVGGTALCTRALGHGAMRGSRLKREPKRLRKLGLGGQQL